MTLTMSRIACLIGVLFFSGCLALNDPCTPGNYQEIHEHLRSVNNLLKQGETGLCDSGLAKGWYRFLGPGGTMMADSCIHRFHCGTPVPVWLNGSHPAPGDGMVTRTACANYGSNTRSTPCCDHHISIGIKNCGAFYVYFLNPTAVCPAAYCIKSTYPELTGHPTISTPILVGHTFQFVCSFASLHLRHSHNVSSAERHHGFGLPRTLGQGIPPRGGSVTEGPLVIALGFDFLRPGNTKERLFLRAQSRMVETEWTFDGLTDPAVPSIITDSSVGRVALPGTALYNHLGTSVGCRVRAWYSNASSTAQKSPWQPSNQYFAGITLSPDKLQVSERGGVQDVQVTSTIPIVCDHNYTASCCLHLMLDVDGPKNNLVVSHACTYKLCTPDWNPTTHTASSIIKVAATKDGIVDGDRDMLLRFEKIETAGGGPYLHVFSNYSVPTLPLVVKDAKTHMCSWSGDPHFTGFDGSHFNVFDEGDFTIYENKRDNFEIQARYVKCGRHASCQCGMVIHEEGDVIRINNCASRRPTAPTVETNHKPLRQGTTIQRSRDGRHIMIYLPSGRQVRVDSPGRYQNVVLTVPGSDDGVGRGLCGDLAHSTPYAYRNGSRAQTPCRRGSSCIPRQFAESWRNDRNTSLFYTVPPSQPKGGQQPPHYCQCDSGTSGQSRINCSVTAHNAHVQRCGSSNCVAVTNQLPSFMTATGWSTTRRAAGQPLYEDLDQPDPPVVFDILRPLETPTWPTPSGIHWADAHQACMNKLRSSQLYAHCNTSQGAVIITEENCITDILYGDSYDMAEASIADFTAQCQFSMIQDIGNYDDGIDGSLVLKNVVTEVCSVSCADHGRCVKGQCVCEPGFTGDNCQMIEGQAPQLLEIRGSNYCDINQRPCRKVFMDAEHFQMNDTFLCRIQEVFANGSVSNDSHDLPAEFISGCRLACPLPDAKVKTERSVKQLALSVTCDGYNYSNALHFTVFDSTCQTCDQTGCTQKAQTCLIEELCYQDNDFKAGDATRYCNSSLNATHWSFYSHGFDGESNEDMNITKLLMSRFRV